MEKKGVLTKVLAIIGTMLVWFPILAPIVMSVIRFAARHVFRFDYLMPAELFLFALVGGSLLLWSALRVRAYRGIISRGLGSAVGMLVGGQALAVFTGMASGDIEPTGWPWVLVLGSLGAYSITLVAMGIGGVLLMRHLFPCSRP